MLGYDRDAALLFIMDRIKKKAPRRLLADLSRLTEAMIDLDIQYLHLCGALDESGDTGDGEYDADDAFEFILDHLTDEQSADEAYKDDLAALLNEFFDAQYAFMEHSGLVET